MNEDVVIRPASASDASFILSSWLQSFRESRVVRGIPAEIYFANHHEIIESILESSTTLVLVDATDHDVIVGWICFESVPNALFVHYVYVKQTFRNRGFGRMLAETARSVAEGRVGAVAAVFCTHPTSRTRQVSWLRHWILNPYEAFRRLR